MYMFTRWVLVAGVVALIGTGAARAVEPQRPGQQSSISRALFAEGRLWVRSDAGELSSLAPGAKVWTSSYLTDPVLDFCVAGSTVRALTCPRDGCGTWTLHDRAQGQWTTSATIDAAGDSAAVITCPSSGATIVVTSSRLIEVAAAKINSIALSKRLPLRGVTALHETSRYLFVGVNAGEWGGGLHRIERSTGHVSTVEKTSRELCSGPLNAACDPVNAIVDDPWKTGCLVAAVGLVHFFSHGRLVEICGDDIEVLYTRPRDVTPTGKLNPKAQATEAFFGLSRTPKGLVAVGLDGVYRLAHPDAADRTSLPPFETIGGIGLSFDVPGVILVATNINQRRSVSGNVPLLVSR